MAGDGGAGGEARRARKEEEARQRRIKEGTEHVRGMFFNKFDKGYYDELKGALNLKYDDDVQQQYKDAVQGLQAALMRAGLGDSSVAAQKTAQAGEKYDTALADVERAKNSVVQQRQQDVASAENSVISQLATTADKDAAFSNASSQIAANYAQPNFPVLGQLFTDFTAGLAAQAEAERQGTNKYNLGVSNWGNNARRYFSNIGGK